MPAQPRRSACPGLLVRLSFVIVLQVLFVFASLALILFQRDEHLLDALDFRSVHDKLTAVVERLEAPASEGNPPEAPLADPVLSGFLADHEAFQRIVIIGATGANLATMYDIAGGSIGTASYSAPQERSDLLDEATMRLQLEMPPGSMTPRPLGPTQWAYYYTFEFKDGDKAVLAAVADHDTLVSHRPDLLYAVLVLLLCSVLLALLTVHLIQSRIRQPLQRLQTGIEKTAQGELYHLIEPQGDRYLRQLAESFNAMSERLCNNSRMLTEKSMLLKDAYLQQAESQVFLATLVDNSPTSILAVSPDGEIVLFNQRAAEVFGYDSSEIIGQPVSVLFLGHAQLDQAMDPSRPDDGEEVVCRRKDGTQFAAYLKAAAVRTPGNGVSATIFNILDISESRDFQEMMVNLDRYYMRGQMAGDIAHEINNYLAVLSGNIELMPLFLRKNDTEKIFKKLDLMKGTVDRIASFADGLMDASHGEACFESTDLNQVIENMLAFLRPQNRFDGIDFRTELSQDLPLAEVDGGQLQQTLINLIHNAADALAGVEGPRQLIIRTAAAGTADAPAVRIEVHDSGPGVADERLPMLFEQRFTTKRKGHGYGLITCRRIVEVHRGRIGYEYRDGALFWLELPTVHTPAHSTAVASTESARSV